MTDDMPPIDDVSTTLDFNPSFPNPHDTNPIQSALRHNSWISVEALLADPIMAQAVDVDFSTVQTPIERHVRAVQLCIEEASGYDPWMLAHICEGYEMAYVVAWCEEEEGQLPLGMSELVCEYVLASPGLAHWSMKVQRGLRAELKKLRSLAEELGTLVYFDSEDEDDEHGQFGESEGEEQDEIDRLTR
eukprot:TRINITY_DN4351_c0_g1_i1.p1 TRINITY_DN4351_c0_g1~~TRINITY_DN4351_c0_g1_i1.p1  ORF type:complete len:189 (-),score=31.88 TRINITY_DN4351_c0_g1_i1:256-822(-)